MLRVAPALDPEDLAEFNRRRLRAVQLDSRDIGKRRLRVVPSGRPLCRHALEDQPLDQPTYRGTADLLQIETRTGFQLLNPAPYSRSAESGSVCCVCAAAVTAGGCGFFAAVSG